MEIPSSVYALIGFLIVSNLTILGSIVVLIFKAGLFVAETKANIKDAKDSSIRAHKRIDKLEE